MLFSRLSYRSLFTIHRPLIQQPLLNTVCCILIFAFTPRKKGCIRLNLGTFCIGRAEKRGKMGFIMEFAENLVLKLMEDPKERDRRFREHVYRVKDRCEKTKEMWSYPMRPYGFWTFERHNSQLAWDAQISQVPGRRDPYDDLLQHYSAPPK
ncbi:uncharacterized protein LOC108338356 [Vigna angularis]|uniref:uncharacterized protein LOC108338356 n=1 Tax=Phaseolus angularis TaxID=3914 RepID=UPI0022B37317|nr:uncharacterized protein LOC108338356 [Vigna angularis]